MKRRDKQVKSKWKKYFFLLLTINVVIVLGIMLLIFWPVSSSTIPSTEEVDEQKSSQFTVRTSKDNLNELVNAYLDKLLDNSRHHYSIELKEDVHLLGELPVFSSTIPLSVHFEPLVQENGDVILKQKSISVGLLELPNQKIMEYMKKYLPMPEWVTVNPKEEEIYVAVTNMDIRSNFKVSIENFDLEANNLAFKIHVPYKTLGIKPDSNE
ncbi:YpmS family protein [Virgibacillus necropolis]|uniref:YpmS family protein n=1 Tax=Virgibacillus necropolis TaxID=163877 RepID=UPI00384EADD4